MELLLADNGVGIEKEDLKHIFERLYKCDKGRSEKGSSSCEYVIVLCGEYYSAAEPPVRCGESHLSGLTEPPHFVY